MTGATAVREIPILFGDEMARAILDGRKTQTRRVVSRKHLPFVENLLGGLLDGKWNQRPFPYGRPGDRLWVREAWTADIEIPGDGRAHWWHEAPKTFRNPRAVSYLYYRADGAVVHGAGWNGAGGEGVYSMPWEHRASSWEPSADDLEGRRWRPSIHMPRWASRITLEVTGVRVERVNEISEADAVAEGVERTGGDRYWLGGPHPVKGTRKVHGLASLAFRDLWDSINAGRGYSWDASPWVWVIEFRRLSGGVS